MLCESGHSYHYQYWDIFDDYSVVEIFASGKRNILRYSKWNYCRPQCGRKRQSWSVNSEGPKPTKDYSHSRNMYWNLESTLRPLFQLLSKRNSEVTTPYLHMSFWPCCPQPVQKHQILLPHGLFTCRRAFPASLFPSPFITNVNSFKTGFFCKEPLQFRVMDILPFSSSADAGGSDSIPTTWFFFG